MDSVQRAIELPALAESTALAEPVKTRPADAWEEFMNEVFHHGLRIAPEIGVGSLS